MLNEPQTTYLVYAPDSRQCIFRGSKEATYAYLESGIQDGEYRVFGNNKLQDVKKARNKLEILPEFVYLSDHTGKYNWRGTRQEVQRELAKFPDNTYLTLEGKQNKLTISKTFGKWHPDNWDFVFSWCCDLEEEEEQKPTAPVFLQEGAVWCES